jgi:class 3 adenylate cyclase/tetratricopeptide (TPR) repeat protein
MDVVRKDRLSASPPERRYLTIMFIDLVGYTELSEQLEPDDLLALSNRYHQLALAIMERFGGFVAHFLGDGVLVYFGYPTAHGNDAERALRAALEMTERLSAMDFPLSEGGTRRLAARIGVHTGLVIVGAGMMSSSPNVHGIVGEAPNLAARLQREAPQNGVVVSRDTRGLVEDLFDFAPLGARLLKGLSQPVEISQVLRAKPAAEYERTRRLRSATSMVGREAALSRMLAGWKTVCEQSRSQVLVVAGDAGVGKTRLVNEFFSHPAVGSMAIVQAHCYEIFANTALFPFASYLWKRTGLALGDDEDARQQKLARILDEYGLSNEENRKILAGFPGMTTRVAELPGATTQLTKLKQYRLIISILDRAARNRQMVVSIEDVHWLDPSSSELLIELAATLREAPLLILLTTRSFPRGPALPAANEDIFLEQLGTDDCLEIAKSVPGALTLPQALLARAVEAADGVPLFVEQLVRSLVDTGERDHRRGRKALDLPLILAEMMSERLDRLPAGRRIVQAAACLGRSFMPEFLAVLLEENIRDIAETLELLVEAEILQPKRYGVELRYEFRHALLQRMARNSIIEPDRRAMHAKIVDLLRAQKNVPILWEVVAYHLTEAGAFHDAVSGWLAAGLHSTKQSAHLEAIDHLKKGLALLDKIRDENLRREFEIDLQAALNGSINITQGPTSPELSICCERGLQLCRETGRTHAVFPFIFGQFTFANCRGQIEEAKSLADLFLSLADDEGYEAGRVVGHRLRGMWLLGQGKAAPAKTELQASLDLYSHERHAASTDLFGQNAQVHTQSLLTLAMFVLGDVEDALRLGRDTLLAADALRHPNSTAIALSYIACNVFGFCQSPDHLMRGAKRLIALADQHRLGGFRAHGVAFMGWALSQQGKPEQGIALMAQAIERFDAAEYRLGVAGHLANLADAQRLTGRLSEAKASAARALRTTFVSGNGWLEPELRRIDALIVSELSSEHRTQAAEILTHACHSARENRIPVFERRCLRSLRDLGELAQENSEPLARLAYLDDLKGLVDRIVGSAVDL